MMRWEDLLSAKRCRGGQTRGRNAKSSDLRSEFEKDYHRIIGSASFRRLQDKTQVFPLDKSDFIRTRLTHSMEVSSLAKSLGQNIGESILVHKKDSSFTVQMKEDICNILQCAGLIHDIGNPPFGHAGEYAIRDWFMHPDRKQILQNLNNNEQLDLLAYEGNAQGFRILTRNEHHPDLGGMRLTCATLGAFMKYPWLATHSNPVYQDSSIDQNNRIYQGNHTTNMQKFGCFYSEAAQLEQLAETLGLPYSKQHDGFARHPLAYLLEAADDICYALIDLEDGINLNMLSYAEVAAIFYELIGERPDTLILPTQVSVRQRLASLRARAMMRLVNAVTDAFVANSDTMLAGMLPGSLFAHCEPSVQSGINQAKQLAREKIFNHPSKVRMELMANQCLQRLLDAFMPLAWIKQTNEANETNAPISQISFEQQRLLKLLQPHLDEHRRTLADNTYDNMLNVLDFITGMNDHEAYRLAQELQGHWGTIV